jgi:hypothetical protein
MGWAMDPYARRDSLGLVMFAQPNPTVMEIVKVTCRRLVGHEDVLTAGLARAAAELTPSGPTGGASPDGVVAGFAHCPLGVAIVVAVTGFRMPASPALLAASEGAVFGLFPIMWIVITAVWLYQLTVISGRFEDQRRAFQAISDDARVQAVIIAFCFGALLEALAGFGAPVAITGVMLTS